jgi:hypothetical protein
MNILLLTAEDGRTGISLCTTRGEAHCALEGEVVTDVGAVNVALRDAGGAQLHQARVHLFTQPNAVHVPSAAQTTGVLRVLAWLAERNIRVDLVAHRIAHHAEHDHILRLEPDRVAMMAEFQSCKPAVYCIEAVAATVNLPQVAFFAARPHTALGVACALAAAGLQAPPGCPKKLKVRCDTCCAN